MLLAVQHAGAAAETSDVKLIDFGLAVQLPSSSGSSKAPPVGRPARCMLSSVCLLGLPFVTLHVHHRLPTVQCEIMPCILPQAVLLCAVLREMRMLIISNFYILLFSRPCSL